MKPPNNGETETAGGKPPQVVVLILTDLDGANACTIDILSVPPIASDELPNRVGTSGAVRALGICTTALAENAALCKTTTPERAKPKGAKL